MSRASGCHSDAEMRPCAAPSRVVLPFWMPQAWCARSRSLSASVFVMAQRLPARYVYLPVGGDHSRPHFRHTNEVQFRSRAVIGTASAAPQLGQRGSSGGGDVCCTGDLRLVCRISRRLYAALQLGETTSRGNLILPSSVEVVTGRRCKGGRAFTLRVFHSFDSGSDGGARSCVCNRDDRVGQHSRLCFELVEPLVVDCHVVGCCIEVLCKRVSQRGAIDSETGRVVTAEAASISDSTRALMASPVRSSRMTSGRYTHSDPASVLNSTLAFASRAYTVGR